MEEFENSSFQNLYDQKWIHREVLASKTPQQNSVVERKNRTM